MCVIMCAMCGDIVSECAVHSTPRTAMSSSSSSTLKPDTGRSYLRRATVLLCIQLVFFQVLSGVHLSIIASVTSSIPRIQR